jgi:DNA-binding response OmpR family regulator
MMKRILLAEDEEVLRMLVVDTLEDEDYEVDEAADGMEAVQLLESNTYDLIILDYMMPGYTGLEIIEKIQSSEIKKQGKILMLSAKSQQFEQERILEAGADYFMAKPFSPLKLIEKIEVILHETESLLY